MRSVRSTARIGVGTLWSSGGTLLLERARYLLTSSNAQIAAEILNPPEPPGFPSWAMRSGVVLQLADGRRWDCSLTNPKGRLTGRGERGLYRES